MSDQPAFPTPDERRASAANLRDRRAAEHAAGEHDEISLIDCPACDYRRVHAPALTANRPIENLRLLVGHAADVASTIREEVNHARNRGYSWERIAEALRPRRGYALGGMFPGGVSTTTVRRMYEEGSR